MLAGYIHAHARIIVSQHHEHEHDHQSEYPPHALAMTLVSSLLDRKLTLYAHCVSLASAPDIDVVDVDVDVASGDVGGGDTSVTNSASSLFSVVGISLLFSLPFF